MACSRVNIIFSLPFITVSYALSEYSFITYNIIMGKSECPYKVFCWIHIERNFHKYYCVKLFIGRVVI
jgi:hypothetical protein